MLPVSTLIMSSMYVVNTVVFQGIQIGQHVLVDYNSTDDWCNFGHQVVENRVKNDSCCNTTLTHTTIDHKEF